jgi:hypothetical protein
MNPWIWFEMASDTQMLDYLNIPFKSTQCHELGHVHKDCDKGMTRKLQRKKEQKDNVANGGDISHNSTSPCKNALDGAVSG